MLCAQISVSKMFDGNGGKPGRNKQGVEFERFRVKIVRKMGLVSETMF